MRKIVLFIASSLDGQIARENGGVDWLFTDSDYGYKKFYKSIDTMLMGRKTYEKALELGDTSYNEKKWYVFSRKPKMERKEATNNVEFVSDPVEFTLNIKKRKGKPIWLVGGSDIISLFLKNDLIDEIMLFVHPVILGSGIPLFKDLGKQTNAKLEKKTAFKSGLVLLHYKVVKKK